MVTRYLSVMLGALLLTGCDLKDADDRFERSQAAVQAALGPATLTASGIRVRTEEDRLIVRAGTPSLDLRLESEAGGRVSFTLENVGTGSRITPTPHDRRTRSDTALDLTLDVPPGGMTLKVRPSGSGPLRFAVISDLHGNLETMQTFLDRMQAYRPDMVLCMGDFTVSGERAQLEEITRPLARLPAPVYATIGNHELMGEAGDAFLERFGPTSQAFDVRGVKVVLLDSASAVVAPGSFGWLAQALRRESGPAIVLTHMPPLEPWGTRDHAFSNRDNALQLLQVLFEGAATHLFVGHIHAFAQYTQRGIPTTISGTLGGGVEVLQDTGHHYLEVVVDPLAPVHAQVGIVLRDLD